MPVNQVNRKQQRIENHLKTQLETATPGLIEKVLIHLSNQVKCEIGWVHYYEIQQLIHAKSQSPAWIRHAKSLINQFLYLIPVKSRKRPNVVKVKVKKKLKPAKPVVMPSKRPIHEEFDIVEI